MGEEWRKISVVDGYEVSNFGRVRSVDRIVERFHPNGTLVKQPLKGQVISQAACKNGYLYVNLKGKHIQVHRLVAVAFVDGYAKGLDVAHENNDRHDNRSENLRWKSRKDNLADQLRHGTRLRGESQNGAKLTAGNVLEMRKMRREGVSWRLIGIEFGVATMTAKNAVVGNTWKHID